MVHEEIRGKVSPSWLSGYGTFRVVGGISNGKSTHSPMSPLVASLSASVGSQFHAYSGVWSRKGMSI